MYKKITHNIVEEHFGHPAAANIKSTIDKKVLLHPAPMVDAVSALKDTSKKLWHHFLWGTRHLFVSAMDGLPEQPATSAQLAQYIADIGDFYKPYYGDNFSNKLMTHLTELTANLAEIAKGIKAGKDVTQMKATNAAHVNSIWELFSGGYIPTGAVKEKLTTLTDSWIAQMEYRAKKDWTSDMKEMTAAYDALLGAPNGTTSGLSDIIADSIIQQFPEKFKI